MATPEERLPPSTGGDGPIWSVDEDGLSVTQVKGGGMNWGPYASPGVDDSARSPSIAHPSPL